MKIRKEPILQEDLSIYDFEKKILTQEPNRTAYYIPGKLIVRTDSGDFFYTELDDEDKGFFFHNEMIEADYLRPVTELPAADREAIAALEQLNDELEGKPIRAVALEGKDDKLKALIIHDEHPENTYFRIALPVLRSLTDEQISALPEYNEERPLDAPYEVQIDDGVLIAY